MIASMSLITNPQEAVMGQAIPAKPPTVVRQTPMRALLAFVALAVAGIAVTAVILANNNNQSTTDANVASRGPAPAQTTVGQRYDGGPEEGTRGLVQTQRPPARYDGGPEEGTAAIAGSAAPNAGSQTIAGQRYDGGPEEGSASIARSSAPDAPAGGIPSAAAARNLEQSGQIELRRDPHSAAVQLHQLQGR
jgi:uncharacterized iron-regulated membrane protein